MDFIPTLISLIYRGGEMMGYLADAGPGRENETRFK
jgi:hypothetical protein